MNTEQMIERQRRSAELEAVSAEADLLAAQLAAATSALVPVGGVWLCPASVRAIYTQTIRNREGMEDGVWTMIDGVPVFGELDDVAEQINALRDEAAGTGGAT